jgi:hypothetical protein
VSIIEINRRQPLIEVLKILGGNIKGKQTGALGNLFFGFLGDWHIGKLVVFCIRNLPVNTINCYSCNRKGTKNTSKYYEFYHYYFHLFRKYMYSCFVSAPEAGYRLVFADTVICMDADLQHPPELIPQLIDEWRKGVEVVATIRISIDKQPLMRRLL